MLQLKIKVAYTKSINIFCAELDAEFVCPPAITCGHLGEFKFIKR
jgi:hypothetical protein